MASPPMAKPAAARARPPEPRQRAQRVADDVAVVVGGGEGRELGAESVGHRAGRQPARGLQQA